MGTQTIPDRSNGQNIDETWFDVISQVVSGDFVPRTSGVPTDAAGNIGSVTYLWASILVKSLKLIRANGDNAITVQSPTSLAAAYSITLPASLPGSTLPVSLSSAGVLSSAQISTAQIADAAVTQAKRAALGQQLSSSSGSFSTSSASYVDVTNLSVSITTTGRPVMLLLVDDNSTIGSVQATSNNGNVGMSVKLLRGATKVSEQAFQNQLGAVTSTNIAIPPGSVNFFDTPSAGTYTYKVQVTTTLGSSPTANVNNCKLLAFEL